jgi:hypothetical protein
MVNNEPYIIAILGYQTKTAGCMDIAHDTILDLIYNHENTSLWQQCRCPIHFYFIGFIFVQLDSGYPYVTISSEKQNE